MCKRETNYISLKELLQKANSLEFYKEQSSRVIDDVKGRNIVLKSTLREVTSDEYNKYTTPVLLFDAFNLIRFTYYPASKRLPIFVKKHIKAYKFVGFVKGVTISSFLTQLSCLLSYNSYRYDSECSVTISDDFRKRAIDNLLQCKIRIENVNLSTTFLQEGSTLNNGRYTIKKVLGSGGFAVTYLAIDSKEQNKDIVIKELFMNEYCKRDSKTYDIIAVNSSDNEQIIKTAIAKFIGEVEKIKNIQHPNIVKVFDAFAEHNTYYYTMEYLQNGYLEDLISKGKISEQDAVKYIKGVASGLAKMHSMNMAHLDIKPANIMLNNEGEAVIIDFGSTKRCDSMGMQCTGNPLVLSNRFAAPELFTNKHLTQFSPKADVYSLGATLFVMLTKRLPIDYRYTKGLSNKIKNVIRRATAKFNYRINNIEEFLAILNE